MKVLRTLAYAAIILAVLVMVQESVKLPGFVLVLGYLRFGSFVPFALATAAAINGQRGIVITVVILSVLSIMPCTIEVFAHALVPIGVGILAGTSLHTAITDAHEEEPARKGTSQ